MYANIWAQQLVRNEYSNTGESTRLHDVFQHLYDIKVECHQEHKILCGYSSLLQINYAAINTFSTTHRDKRKVYSYLYSHVAQFIASYLPCSGLLVSLPVVAVP